MEKSLRVKGEGRVRNVRGTKVLYYSFRKVDLVVGHQKKGLWKEVLESMYRGWRSLKAERNSRSDSLWWRDLKEI